MVRSGRRASCPIGGPTMLSLHPAAGHPARQRVSDAFGEEGYLAAVNDTLARIEAALAAVQRTLDALTARGCTEAAFEIARLPEPMRTSCSTPFRSPAGRFRTGSHRIPGAVPRAPVPRLRRDQDDEWQNSAISRGSKSGALAIPEKLRKRADRPNRRIRTRLAQSFGNRRMLENADNGYTCAPSHSDVFRRISDIDARARFETELANGHLKLHRMRLAMGHLVAKDTYGKELFQSQCGYLGTNSQPAAAADQPQPKACGELLHYATRARLKLRAFGAIKATPKPVRLRPAFRRQMCGPVNVMPVR